MTGYDGLMFPNDHGRSIFIALVGGVLLMLSACHPNSRGELVVGMELNYPPFEMVDPQGGAQGISVEMAKALGAFLHRNVEIRNIPFDGLIPALKTGKIDLIISSMTETPARAESIAFSEPYVRTGLCLLVNKAAPIEAIGQADRAGYSIAVKQGTTGQLYAQRQFKQARVLVLDKEDACVLEVVQGKAQAFIYDQMSVFKHWQQHPEATKAVLRPFQEEVWAIGLRREDPSLKAQVNEFLQAFRAEGGFARLGDQYLGKEKEAFAKLGIAFYF
jgi:polar amino acid transport system substrate-binding protein